MSYLMLRLPSLSLCQLSFILAISTSIVLAARADGLCEGQQPCPRSPTIPDRSTNISPRTLSASADGKDRARAPDAVCRPIRPILVVYDSDTLAQGFGPLFVLYSDGLIIHVVRDSMNTAVSADYAYVRLSQREIRCLLKKLRLADGYWDVPDTLWARATGGVIPIWTYVLVSVGDTFKRITFRNFDLRACFSSGSTKKEALDDLNVQRTRQPRVLVDLLKEITRYTHKDELQWSPSHIELVLWADDSNAASDVGRVGEWPTALPPIDRLKVRREIFGGAVRKPAFCIVLDARYKPVIDRLLRNAHVIRLFGFRFTISMRYVFPGEELWNNGLFIGGSEIETLMRASRGLSVYK